MVAQVIEPVASGGAAPALINWFIQRVAEVIARLAGGASAADVASFLAYAGQIEYACDGVLVTQ